MSDKTETPRTDAAWNPATVSENGLASIMEEMKTLERELTQWREVAGRLATAITLYGNGKPELIHALNAYDALAKLSDGGKG